MTRRESEDLLRPERPASPRASGTGCICAETRPRRWTDASLRPFFFFQPRPLCRQLQALEKALKFPGLTAAAAQLRDHPTAEGLTVKGPKRTSARLFVPDLVFDEHIEMGENIFFYMGELSECYVIYWPDRPVAEVQHG